jgi:murein DD-endopeptidase MepM/ murein hydrolase activator NlpD
MRQTDQEQTGLLARIRTLDKNQAKTQTVVQSLDSDIAALDSRIAANHEQLRASTRRLADLTDQLQSILRKLDRRTQAFTARAVAAYKAGPTGNLDALLSSQSFGDLMDTYTYYQSAVAEDASLMHQIQDLRDAIETHRTAVENSQRAILAARARLQNDRHAVARERSKKRLALADLKSLIHQKHAAVNQIETKKTALEQAIAENQRESAQIGALLQAAGGPAGPALSGGGQFLWPAVGPITSPFGWRIHPIFGTREFHAGVDIGVPYGTTVAAADSGTVEFAGTMTGYGNVVVIDHGAGLATLYGHLSAYSVMVGQVVGRGSPIANVGCTGYCTGPHLHFEVRLNGSPVDPLPYLQ